MAKKKKNIANPTEVTPEVIETKVEKPVVIDEMPIVVEEPVVVDEMPVVVEEPVKKPTVMDTIMENKAKREELAKQWKDRSLKDDQTSSLVFGLW